MKSLTKYWLIGLLAGALPTGLAAGELSPRTEVPPTRVAASLPAPSVWDGLRQALGQLAKTPHSDPNPAKLDPTRAGPMLRPLLDRSKNGRAEPLPAITVRARVLNSHLPPAALLDIGGQLHMVRQGDDFSLPQSTYSVRIVELDRRTVRLEVEAGKQIITLD